jgi:ribosome-binding factor A
VAQGHRPQRVGDQIRQELSELLTRGAVHDPGIGFITLTRVSVTSDLQIARVFYTLLGDAARQRETQQALERATPFLRREVGQRVRLRRVPELEFRLDQAVAHQDRIEQVLRDLHAEEAARLRGHAATADPAGPSSDGASPSGRAGGAGDDGDSH